jgi:hypothetical protein
VVPTKRKTLFVPGKEKEKKKNKTVQTREEKSLIQQGRINYF